MRVNAILALGACAAFAKADIADEVADALKEGSSTVGSVVESVTSSVVSKPTFTVRKPAVKASPNPGDDC